MVKKFTNITAKRTKILLTLSERSDIIQVRTTDCAENGVCKGDTHERE